MPIQEELLGFWWFRDQQVGGMGQPGFNRIQPDYPDEFTPQEHMLRNWMAKLPQPRVSLSNLKDYLDWWNTVVVPFLGLPIEEFDRYSATLLDREGFLSTADRVQKKSGLISRFHWDDEGEPHVELEVDAERIRKEVDILERHGVSVLVSMVETPPHPAVLESKLEVHHFPVDDATPPDRAQAEAFSEVLDRAYSGDQKAVVHCMAGIGRTTTIIVAGHLFRGERLETIEKELQTTNPRFLARGPQWRFLEELADELDLR